MEHQPGRSGGETGGVTGGGPQAAGLEEPPHLLRVGRTSRVCSLRPLGHGGLCIAWNCPGTFQRARAPGVDGVQESGGRGEPWREWPGRCG